MLAALHKSITATSRAVVGPAVAGLAPAKTDGGGNIDASPAFVDGSHGNLRLDSASHAIDAGNNDAIPAGVTTDLDGNPRFIDGDGDRIAVVDIGAYEWQLYKYKFYLFPIFK